ncbi:MAG: sugar ABC transporter permease [Oscillospiraceae bacterium]|nr:sugar ABC transporter permease [Oscillospiraceae bacterium]
METVKTVETTDSRQGKKPLSMPPQKGGLAGKIQNLPMNTKNAIAGYLFISPFIIGFLAFMFFPMLESVRMSFSEVTMDLATARFSLAFTGFENYRWVFRVDPEFMRLLTEELRNMAFSVPAVIVFSFFVALILNQKFKFRGVVRSVFFLPVILSAGVMLGLENSNALLRDMQDLVRESNAMTSTITGVLEDLIGRTGFTFMDVLLEYVFATINRIYDIALISGIQIIIFLSGLQTISPSMYEASKIEGATAWENFWKITFPMISSLILVNVIYSVIDYFVRSDNRVMAKVTGAISGDVAYGHSFAMAWSYFGIVIVIVGILALIISRKVYYYE